MKTKTLTIGLIVMACVLAPLAMAGPNDGPGGQRGPHGKGGGSFGPHGGGGFQGRFQGPEAGVGNNFAGMLLEGLGKRLNLTDDQKAQIKAILEVNMENMETARKSVGDSMMALNEAAGNGVKAEIIAAGKAVGDAFTEQALQRANIAKQAKAVLTEEQLAKLEEMKEQMKERMQQRRQGPRDGEGAGQRSPRQGRGEGERPRGERSGRRSKDAK